MPGYTIGESLKKQATESLKTIEQLIESHDVIYLLTDSRESRWLPTMLAAAHDKVRQKLKQNFWFELRLMNIIFFS